MRCSTTRSLPCRHGQTTPRRLPPRRATARSMSAAPPAASVGVRRVGRPDRRRRGWRRRRCRRARRRCSGGCASGSGRSVPTTGDGVGDGHAGPSPASCRASSAGGPSSAGSPSTSSSLDRPLTAFGHRDQRRPDEAGGDHARAFQHALDRRRVGLDEQQVDERMQGVVQVDRRLGVALDPAVVHVGDRRRARCWRRR